MRIEESKSNGKSDSLKDKRNKRNDVWKCCHESNGQKVKIRSKKIYLLVCVILVVICIFPFLIVLGKSFFEAGRGFSLQAWYKVFLGSPKYLYRFWKSLLMCLGIAVGQIIVSALAGYGFAKCDFSGKRILFFGLMMLMVLPLQVTLVPNYIVLDKLHLLDTYASLILPGIFIPLGTFIMTCSFRAVSDDVIDAARLDGCSERQVLIRIAVPMAKGSMVCVGVLSFLDAWNMVEQPIAYLREFEDYPLSVALASVSVNGMNIQLVCSILVLIPPALLFVLWGRELVKGIAVGEQG